MTYWLIGDEEPEDHRFIQAGPGACGLYFMAGAWCMRQIRYRPESEIPPEWFIPDHYVRSWPNGARLAARLVHTGLWVSVEGGYYFTWIQPDNTADHVRGERKRERDKWARRQAAKRLLDPPTPQGSYRGEFIPENGVRDSRKKWEQGDDQ
jgi:hypothetical protein